MSFEEMGKKKFLKNSLENFFFEKNALKDFRRQKKPAQ